MLLKQYCQNKTIDFIEAFLEHSLWWHYCIHLPEYQHPLLGQLVVLSLDSLQLLPLGILLSQFQFPLHLPYPIIPVHVLWPPPCAPIPISQSPPSEFSHPNFSPCHLNHQPLFSPICAATSALPYPCSWFTLFFPIKIYSQTLFPPASRFFTSVSPLWISFSPPQINLLRKIPAMDGQMTQKIEEREPLSFSSGPGTTEAIPNWQ